VGSETELAGLRDELSSWLEPGRWMITMLEKIQVVSAAQVRRRICGKDWYWALLTFLLAAFECE
jgi:hypothetical protein